jgi:hypothetical protein
MSSDVEDDQIKSERWNRPPVLSIGVPFASSCGLGAPCFHLSDPVDYQITDLFSPQKPGWPRMVPALDNGDPGNSVIEHRRICSENRIFEGYIYWISWQKVA